MNPKTCDAALKVLAEDMGKFAMMFGEKAGQKEIAAVKGGYFICRAVYKGATNGSLILAATEGFCKALWKNIMCSDDDCKVDEAGMVDALNEFANVACGHFLTEVYGRKGVFNITAPVTEKCGQEEWEETAVKTCGGFIVDGDVIAVYSETEE